MDPIDQKAVRRANSEQEVLRVSPAVPDSDGAVHEHLREFVLGLERKTVIASEFGVDGLSTDLNASPEAPPQPPRTT